MAELFTIAKIWKQPKCPSVDECIRNKKQKTKNSGTLTQCNAAVKKEETLTFCNSMTGLEENYAK